MLTLPAVLFVFGLLISAHEFGHFSVAKLSGMKVVEFAVGFGPGILKKQYGETLYSLRCIPLGGYTKIAGDNPDDEDDPRNFDRQPIVKRLLVVVAGSAVNLLLPVVLFFLVIVFSGVQKSTDLPFVGAVMENMPAAEAGLRENDEILAIEGVKVASWTQMVELLKERGGQSTKLHVRRGGEDFSLELTPRYDEKSKRALIGVAAKLETYRPGITQAAKMAVVETYTVAWEILKGFYRLIVIRDQPADIAGPLGIIHMVGQVAQYGFFPLLRCTAFLSINLGIINLLPIPVLDGGHAVMLLAEGIRGRSLTPSVAQKIQYIGLALLFSLLTFAVLQDISRF
jgi:regulator of sigma E protease